MANMADVTLKNRKGEKKSYNEVEGILLQREGGGTAMYTNLVIDDALSSSSTNPVQNKVVTKALGGTELKFFNVQVTVDFENMSGTSDKTADEIIAALTTAHQVRVNVDDGNNMFSFLPQISLSSDFSNVALVCTGIFEPQGVVFDLVLDGSGEDDSWMLVQHELSHMLSVTYQELVDYAENGQLVPGMQYRITDYETIIRGYYDLSLIGGTGYLPYATSAGHPFDIIVTADSRWKLNENARAIRNEDNTDNGYFENSDLGAWELKYTIYNDPNKHAWADPDNGRGVIYWLKDEFNNDAGYDFKNIQFVRYALKQADSTGEYSPLLHNLVGAPFGDYNDVTNVLTNYLSTGEYKNPFGHRYRGIDVYDYDFKVGANILGVAQFNEIDDNFKATFYAEAFYTFSSVGDLGSGEIYDASLNLDSQNTCTGNHIGACADSALVYLSDEMDLLGLNNIVWIVEDGGFDPITNNYIGEHCWAITSWGRSRDNRIDSYCISLKFGSDSQNNEIGHDNQYLWVDLGSSSCKFESFCKYNTFKEVVRVVLGEECQSNTCIGSATHTVTLGWGCNDNTLEGSVVGTVLANGDSRNIIKDVSATLGFLNDDLVIEGSDGNYNMITVQNGVNNIDLNNMVSNTGMYELKLYDMSSLGGGSAVLSAWTGYNSTLDYLTEDGGQNWTTL